MQNGASVHQEAGRAKPLSGKIIHKFATALKWCREKRGFTLNHVAKNINVSLETLQSWEDATAETPVFPPGIKLTRLIGMMPQLAHFKHLVSKAARTQADMEYAAMLKRGGLDAPPENDPAPRPADPEPGALAAAFAATWPIGPVPAFETFGAALLHARTFRKLKQTVVAGQLGITGTCLGHCEKGLQSPNPENWVRMCLAFPELRMAPVPRFRGAGGRELPTPVLPALGTPLPPVAVAPAPSEPQLPPDGAQNAQSAAPGDAPVEPQLTRQQIAVLYADALSEAESWATEYDARMTAAQEADEKKRAATARAQELHGRLLELAKTKKS
jgi:DNA-binding transcriptional regulator YiaG